MEEVVAAIYDKIGGELTAETMGMLNSDQITLLAWKTLHDEVMEGGFVQLIHNGYGTFIFKNPLAKAAIERDCTDEEFMALFEQYPEFDELDDTFVEQEEAWTEQIAQYVDEHIH